MLPDWDIKVYHSTWWPEFPFSPEETIRQLVMTLFNKGIDNSNFQPFILSTVRDRFPWQNLQHHYWQQGYRTETTYLGDYKGCQDVYSVKLMFSAKADKIIASQKLYLVEQKNEWKIIDVSKVKNNKEQNQVIEEKQPSQSIKDANDPAAAAKLFAQLETAEQI